MNLASFIDHTLLKPEATEQDILQLCQEAREHHFFGVCVNSLWISLCKKQLEKSSVKTVAVIGFPLGACLSQVKVFETKEAILAGADEIDMVIPLGKLKSKDFQFVQEDIQAVVRTAGKIPVKVILETHLLSQEEKMKACELSCAAGAAYVKTSTGFTGGGATIEDIRFMKKSISPSTLVKASGGIKTRDQALAMIEAGASRIGTSSGVSIVTGLNLSPGGY